ncbi:HAMP domain-containing protein [Pseudoalteromonas luteoviolacea]|uniref:ATP-binding protein n=1 Tax=Pseudoalteromonas luteoviolacea TaxID=43657 RepID=UPI001B362D4F|nr:ATP-binding protein [Pseudoalteromonas luteoviolacea]MBQ4814151.1 HAMP domain-containing protein [Pseudoalteromonas luteoviolacea]
MKRFLAIKVFLWFWLTVISTLAIMVSVSFLQPDVLASKDISPPMLKNLFHMKKSLNRHIERMPDKSLEEVLTHRRHGKRTKLYLKHSDPDKSLISTPELNQFDLTLLNFAVGEEPKVINTEKYRAYGPVSMHVKQNNYQLFMILDNREGDLFLKVKLMPRWMKLTILLFASLVLSYWFAMGLLKPIKQLQQAAAKLAQGELSARAQVDNKRRDELGQLGKDFDIMASQLETQVLSQKRLLADISHELRSPLTRLQMATGIAAGKVSGDLDSYMQRIEKESHLLDHMLSDILQLSRLESGSSCVELQPICIAELLEPIISDAQFESQQLNKQLYCGELPEISLVGDAVLLNRAIENIIRNALKYATTKVTIQCNVVDEKFILQVADDGEGVSDEMLDKLCIPFYRASQSRTPHIDQKGGFGLGLAIAQHAIKVHHGHIHFKNNQGLDVTLSIPLTQQNDLQQ